MAVKITTVVAIFRTMGLLSRAVRYGEYRRRAAARKNRRNINGNDVGERNPVLDTIGFIAAGS